jgi:DNA-binding Lrp family transcriptional regulator
MSVAGIIEAMRSHYPNGTRLTWQCIENRAGAGRSWNATDREIAREMRLSTDTVGRAVGRLERDGIVRAVRHKRRRTTFYLLRTYPVGVARPSGEPEIAHRLAPDLSPQNSGSMPGLSPQNAETKITLVARVIETDSSP